jgi:membrane associated rhomboid family serine protease
MVRASNFSVKRRRNPFGSVSVTFILILINVVAFIIFAILLALNTLSLDSIALKPSNILQGKYLWTFITSMFMHGGLFHIFANMFSLLFIGSLVEKILGAKRYFYFYMISGLFAGVLFVLSSLIFVNDFNAFAVGASGALFGLVGLLVLLTPNLRVFIFFIPIPIKMKYAGLGILVVLWLISVLGDIPIGNTAHLGGFVIGIIYGLYLRSKFPKKTRMISKYFG